MKFLGHLRGPGRPALGAAPAAELRVEADRLWHWAMHEDDLLASRVSFFLLAQSVLIAVTAAVVGTSASLGSARHLIR